MAFWRMEWRNLVLSGLLVLTSLPLKLLPAVLTYFMLETLYGQRLDPWNSLGFLLTLQFTGIVFVLLDCHARRLMFRSACRITVSCNLVYRTTLANPSFTEIATISSLWCHSGEVIGKWMAECHRSWAVFVEVAGQVYILSRVVGIDWWVILGIYGAIGRVIIGSAALESWLRTRSDQTKLARWKFINECFRAIQCVKLNAWEERFQTRINGARETERKAVFAHLVAMSLRLSVAWCADEVAIGLVFLYFVINQMEFNPAIAFSSIVVLQLMKSTISICIRRFLCWSMGNWGKYNTNTVVAAQSAFLGYDRMRSKSALMNVNFAVNRDELVVVYGKAGEGKTTLLNAILGEVMCLQGEVFVSGECRVAYCSQNPWVQSLTIRANILFGSPYDETKYTAVLDACDLIDDIVKLPDGDEALVGPRGINLSGGQKARIALARACYADADLYVLDCPLASVDAVIQMEVFRKCIVELLRHKTVIMATHNAEFIHSRTVDRLFKVAGMTVTVSGGSEESATSHRMSMCQQPFWDVARVQLRQPSINSMEL